MEFTIVWVLFIGAVIVLLSVYGKKLKGVKNVQKQQQEAYLQNREKYKVLTSEMFDEVKDEEMTHVALYHILGKEDKLFESDEPGNIIDVLTHGELMIFTIYQLELSLGGKNGSIHTFFIQEPYCQYRPYLKEAFEEINCHQIATLVQAADDLATIVANEDMDYSIDEDSEYATYNFADFTNELLGLMRAGDMVANANKYVREHKDEFIDHDEVKTEEVKEEVNEESSEGDNNG